MSLNVFDLRYAEINCTWTLITKYSKVSCKYINIKLQLPICVRLALDSYSPAPLFLRTESYRKITEQSIAREATKIVANKILSSRCYSSFVQFNFPSFVDRFSWHYYLILLRSFSLMSSFSIRCRSILIQRTVARRAPCIFKRRPSEFLTRSNINSRRATGASFFAG